jgi:hypothetical protein
MAVSWLDSPFEAGGSARTLDQRFLALVKRGEPGNIDKLPIRL